MEFSGIVRQADHSFKRRRIGILEKRALQFACHAAIVEMDKSESVTVACNTFNGAFFPIAHSLRGAEESDGDGF